MRKLENNRLIYENCLETYPKTRNYLFVSTSDGFSKAEKQMYSECNRQYGFPFTRFFRRNTIMVASKTKI